MSGSIVTIRVNGQPYQLGCDVGQEAEIEALGRMVDNTVSQLAGSVGQIGESRLLVMAAILLAEKVAAKGGDAPLQPAQPQGEQLDDAAFERLSAIASQISSLAAALK